ncbi:hypothetical protein XV74_04725 [Vibrio cholerae]|nr:hypothetical protein XV74_04725 [Vibrio cholerae]KQA45096.1 hypothetical protein XV75_10895 [Vibrio cholerae]KQA57256.1 hypothetical protein XV79_08600 [Vibrio cholerae]KQA72234.1 hypothetical protein XV84_16530 [Vibrio cholerae]KQA80466.1 hypothetical protein XV85_01185 [Vibrio cholerae]
MLVVKSRVDEGGPVSPQSAELHRLYFPWDKLPKSLPLTPLGIRAWYLSKTQFFLAVLVRVNQFACKISKVVVTFVAVFK